MLTGKMRLALIGASFWLLPALACSAWLVAAPGPLVPTHWASTVLAVATGGLGVWILLLVVLYRGKLPFCSGVIGIAFAVINLSTDVLVVGPAGSTLLRSHLLNMAPTYVLVGILCAGLGWLATAPRSEKNRLERKP